MRSNLALAGLTLVLVTGGRASQAQVPAPAPPTVTNSIGMQFIRIEPGTMQVAVFHPDCANGARAGGGPGRAAAPPPGALQGAAPPPVAPAAPAGPVPPPGFGGGRGAPRDPRMIWNAEDLAACEAATRADRSDGYPVTLKKAYLIGRTEVTQAQWKAVMTSNPSLFQASRVTNPDNHPVESVTWQNAQAFVKALNSKEKTQAYRLPTEFEWEYACRAGGLGQQSWTEIRAQAVLGLGLPGGRGVANRGGGAPPAAASAGEPVAPETLAQYTARTGMTNEVGTKTPNAWGIHDMLGNVWEWVADPYNGKMFPDATPPKSGSVHVLKGGGFASDVKNAICATHSFGPGDGFAVGFRIVKDVP
jgi:formylglycine-generating enzyme required for sulfatase activity